MPKKQKLLNKNDKKVKSIVLTLAALLVFTALYGGYIFTNRIMASIHAADIVSIREMVLMAAESTKVDAPVDAKTGDIYFPQARLFLANKSTYEQLTYSYYDGAEGGEPELSVSNKLILNKNAGLLYGATDIKQLFEKIPQLQACQRGIQVSYKQLADDQYELRHAVPLQNGKTAQIYVEKNCPDLHETAELLKNIQSY